MPRTPAGPTLDQLRDPVRNMVQVALQEPSASAAPQPEAAAQVEACEAWCQARDHQDMQLRLRPRPTCNLYKVF